MKFYILTALILLNCMKNAVAQPPANNKESLAIIRDDFHQLCGYMTGSFSSELQAQNDSDYYSITLHMAPVWSDREDGYWLYVEQAMASVSEKPYRQRFYQVVLKDENTIESKVFTINDPLRFTGAWQKPELLRNITPDSLELRTGCSILISKTAAGIYRGNTSGNSCPSHLRGAAYATSEVTITSKQMISWDRGFDTIGNQVWGAEKGGYIFDKKVK